ncbi:hypothetical protein CFT13S00388_02650 [Campylobacter fetus subsp. testudinum]|uniref:hypothetical protein n=1 Tax=Campylobacter fetus TaxID=196 RepID=UPI000818B6B1|nr:hypothetical protein [Campylobacter fetus]OCR88084.1 hypothetical protein CFT13S00388_02650 [Campylobacter fetus subsp. testudinum]
MQILTEKLNPYNIKTQAFSATDLRKTKDDVGIVYPLTNGENTPSFSSIVEHIEDRTILACGEYRIVNSQNTDVVYSKGRCINYIYKPDIIIIPSEAESLFDVRTQVFQDSYLVSDELNASVDFITNIISDFKDIDFTPEFIIEASNLSQKEHINVVSSYSKSITSYLGYDDNLYFKNYPELKEKDDKPIIIFEEDNVINKMSKIELVDKIYMIAIDIETYLVDSNEQNNISTYFITILSTAEDIGELERLNKKELLEVYSELKSEWNKYAKDSSI